jgi:NAD(P)H dehydrogenase (quinone)
MSEYSTLGETTGETFLIITPSCSNWLVHLFDDSPIPYRRQNDGDYPDGHELSLEVASGLSGFPAHVRPEAHLPNCEGREFEAPLLSE